MRFTAIFLSLIGISASTFASQASQSLEERLTNMQSISAQFKQSVTAGKKEISKASGNMALQRPGKLRWDTLTPMKQLIVADGHKIWIYDPELEQVTVKKEANNLGATAALFLSNTPQNLAEDFEVNLDTTDAKALYSLKAKSVKTNFSQIKIVFIDNQLSKLELDDELGQHTTIKFTKVKINPNLAVALFQFKPPKGVDIVSQ